MSRLTLDYLSNGSFAGPQGPIKLPSTTANGTDRECCVTLVHKQAPRLL